MPCRRSGHDRALQEYPPAGQPGGAGPPVRVVAALVEQAQPQRRAGQRRAGHDLARAVSGQRGLRRAPRREVGEPVPAGVPPGPVPPAQPEPAGGWQARADPAPDTIMKPRRGLRHGRGEERRQARAGLPRGRPLALVRGAELPPVAPPAAARRDHARPPEDRVAGRNLDHLGAEQRIERRRGDQRGQHLQPVPGRPAVPPSPGPGPARPRRSLPAARPHPGQGSGEHRVMQVRMTVDVLDGPCRRPPAGLTGDQQVPPGSVQHGRGE